MGKRICYGCMREMESHVCPHCGWTEEQNNERHQLPVGTLLGGKYLIGRALGQGGFGITYLGLEVNLNMVVCVKEFYPSNTVNRDSSQSMVVNCNTQTMEASYATSRERFIREAKSLARFRDVPQIVSIYEFFQMNNTAYMVMEFVAGVDMVKYLRQRGGRLPMDQVLQLLQPVMVALTKVHDANLIHRDISPDNIMIQPNGEAKLLDFGAARSVDNPDMEQMLTHSTEAIIKNGFAPMEQYASRGSLGPWTDVYAMSATIYYCLTGKVLENAPMRMLEGGELDWSNAVGVSERQKAILEQGLALNIKERVPSIRALMEALFDATESYPVTRPVGGQGVPNSGINRKPPVSQVENDDDMVSVTISRKKKKDGKKKNPAGLIAAILALVLVLGGGGWYASRVNVAGAEVSESALQAQLLADCSAIGSYDVDSMLPLSGSRTVSFPVGDRYDGRTVIVTDAEGNSCDEVTVEGGTAQAHVPGEGRYLLQIKTETTEDMSWSGWMETLPEGVALNINTVEVDVQYRVREKDYLEYNRETLEGWTLDGVYPSTSPYGEWSEWGEEAVTASEYTEVEEQKLYRFRTNEQTSSTEATMEGWTNTGSQPHYTLGAWSDWTTNPASSSDTQEVQQKSQWNATWRNTFMSQVTTSSTGWVDGTGHPSVGDMQMTGTASYKECISVNTRTVYRKRSRTYQYTTYFFSRWTEWSDWSNEETVAQENLVEVEEKTVYRRREIFGDTAYLFWRWQDWSDWTLEAPAAEENTQMEQRVVYRYIQED